ncbi:hypothetical protein DH2020_019950 [Rehmannia glutinosa]|uniref:Chromo domain-containing protein n=1 Tax=Rehmannia glutinosa TaxID=99300 RepID=A0ABR0WGX1_REHGL
MFGSNPKVWAKWLSMAEWWYNTSHHTSISMSPFEALYGYQPSHIPMGPYKEISVIGVDELLTHRNSIQQQLQYHLNQARTRMKQMADKHRSERSFQVGDLVYLKLKPFRQQSLHEIGPVAYKLQLPAHARIHPVFHVSQLKRRIGSEDIVTSSLPPFHSDGNIILHPVRILARRQVKRNNTDVPQLLIQWAHLPEVEATWEDYSTITQQFPQLQA